MPGLAQAPCLSDTVYARMESQVIGNQFTNPDSTWRARLGMRQSARNITWLRDPAICAEAERTQAQCGRQMTSGRPSLSECPAARRCPS